MNFDGEATGSGLDRRGEGKKRSRRRGIAICKT